MKSIQDTPSWGSASGKKACVVTSGCPHLGQHGLLIKGETYTCSRLDYTYVGTLNLPFNRLFSLGQIFNLSEPQRSHVSNGNGSNIAQGGYGE